MMTKIWDLAFEVDGDSINLEQDMGCGDVARITLHPIHLRLLAETTGMLPPSSNIDTDRTIARLCRQMRILYERIDRLDTWLNEVAQRGHEDLETETAYSFATWELAREFLEELPDTPGHAASRQVTPTADGTCHAAAMANASHASVQKPTGFPDENPAGTRKVTAASSGDAAAQLTLT